MNTPYDAARRGDFTDPQRRTSWFQDESRRSQSLTIRQLRSVIRIARAELLRRDADFRDDEPEVGLAMGLMFAAGLVVGALAVFSIYLVNS